MKLVSDSTRRKRLAATAAILCLAGLLTFCGRPEDPSLEQRAGDPGVLRIDVAGPIESLNPMARPHSASGFVNTFLYSCLFHSDEKGELEPDLATKWTFDPSILTWSIQLRKDALFHDGMPVTSKDVKFSLDEWIKSDVRSLAPMIEKVEVVAEHGIRIALEVNDPEFLQKLCDLDIVPSPEAAATDFYLNPIGSGPFKLHRRHENKEVELLAHEHYHGGRPSLERVVFLAESDSEKSWARLLQGETDVVFGIYPKDYEMIERYKSRFLFDLSPCERYGLVLYNTGNPLFSDPRVRLALTSAIDREYIVKDLLRGFGMVASGPMGVGSPFHDPSVKPVPHNRQKARVLFGEAGWGFDDELGCLAKDGMCFEFTILVFQDNQLDRRVAEYLKLCLNDLGVKMHIKSLPYNKLVERYAWNDDFEAVLTEFKGAYTDPEILREIWSSTPEAHSAAGCFQHPEVTELLSMAVAERDAQKKKALFYQLDALLSSLQPGTFLYHKASLGVMSKRAVQKLPEGNPYSFLRQFKDVSMARSDDSGQGL